MSEQTTYLIILVLFLALDMATVAARASMLHITLASGLELSAAPQPKEHHKQHWLALLPALQASLILAQALWRFLLAGLLMLYLNRLPVLWQPMALLGVLVLAGLVVFALEWAVRSWVSPAPQRWAQRMLPFANALRLLTWPVVMLALLLGSRRRETVEDEAALIEDQVKNLVEAGQQRGLIEQGESRMLYSIFELGDTLAREIMVPRIDMLVLDVTTPPEQAVDALLASGHSRVPVYQDNVDNIIGLLFAKDLLRVWREGEHLENLQPLLRPAYFVPEAKKVNELLAEMQSRRIHMAIIVDEYGGVAGLVTLEDIVEEILGEIQDEYDQGEEMPFQRLPNGEILFQGRIDLDDFNEIMSTHLVKEEADTLAGLLYNRMGKVPSVGDSILIDNLRLTVEQVSGRRIRKVRAGWQSPALQKYEFLPHANG